MHNVSNNDIRLDASLVHVHRLRGAVGQYGCIGRLGWSVAIIHRDRLRRGQSLRARQVLPPAKPDEYCGCDRARRPGDQ